MNGYDRVALVHARAANDFAAQAIRAHRAGRPARVAKLFAREHRDSMRWWADAARRDRRRHE